MKNQLASLRGERGWSQGDLACELKVSRQTINSLEAGKHDPSLALAFEIAGLFGRRIEEVFLYERSRAAITPEPTTRR